MEASGVEQEIKSTLNRRVDLPSGGYLIFDYAEAFTVIDVNTGRFVGSRSKKSTGRLEDTITKNNLEAVKEVVRQLRLRDIGGIIVIDFIDMASPKNRAAVEKALGEELERDRTKTYVVEISPLGLVEMTRQNVTDGPREVMTKKCPTCGGDGIVVSEHTAAVDVERRLRSLVTPGSRAKAFKVEVSARVAWLLAGPGGTRLREVEETAKRRFFLVGKEGEHLDHFKVLEQGTLEKVAPKLPFEVDQEVDVKLGEVGLHDPHAGAGKIEDVDVVVGDAAKLVGKKVKARINVVTDGLAWAELIAPAEASDEPLTAEAEAEKPTRAKRSTLKKAEEPEAVEAEAEDVDAVAEEEPEPAEGDEGAASPAKKKTRRGSRGGRNRKKKSAAVAASTEAEEQVPGTEPVPGTDVEPESAAEAEEEAEPAEGPVIHVPDRELGAEENGDAATPVKKRTRRGSRGGRNRKKKSSAATATVVEAELGTDVDTPEPEVLEEAPSENGDNGSHEDDWGYTPMSEWGLDEK
jgi:ribonuclease G